MISFSISKTMDTAQGKALLDVACEIQQGELVTIYGESGAGKTTILRVLAGLLLPEKGHIVIDGHEWLDTAKRISIAPQKRNVGFVFQDYALFPNMTVRGNLEYALQKGQSNKIVDELTEVMELQQLQARYPETLSGGQKQRVALARALVRQPVLLLLDEPLSALGSEMRYRLQDHILQAHKYYGLTTILVSHDVPEVFKLSDKVFVLEQGKIIRQGTPQAVFFGAEAKDVFRFMGDILDINKSGEAYSLTVLVYGNIVHVATTEEAVRNLKHGDQVILSSETFHPLITKM